MPYQRFAMNKLVRDSIPEIMQRKGARVKSRLLSPDEHISALLDKLHEEVEEARAALNNPTEWLLELVDIQEIIDTLLNLTNIKKTEIQAIQAEKRKSKGGFNNGLWFEYIDCPPDHPDTKRMLADPLKYPNLGVVE